MTHKLIEQKLCHTVINIYKDGQIVIRKIVLHNYMNKFYDESKYIDAFHGTKFKYL